MDDGQAKLGGGLSDPLSDEENMEEMTLDQATAAAAVAESGVNGTNKAKKKKKGKRRRSSARFLNLDQEDDEVRFDEGGRLAG
jgi:hypothetical protein